MSVSARELWQRLLTPFRTRVGWWLAAINAVIVILIVLGLSLTTVGSLRRLADRQDRAQVLLAGAMAREDLRRDALDALSAARVLAERPTLRRLLDERDSRAMQAFVAQYCTGVRFDACALFEQGRLLLSSGRSIDPSLAQAAAAAQGERFFAAPAQGPVLLGATARVAGTGVEVQVLRVLDAAFANELGTRVGLPVRVLNYREFESAPVEPATPVHAAALADGRSAVQLLEEQSLYVSSFPVLTTRGQAIALVEARLSNAATQETLWQLVRRFALVAVGLAVLAMLLSVFLGRRVTEPIGRLTDAARRLGQGDFATPVPVGGRTEVAVLGRTLEDMRRGLIEATSALRRREAEAQAMLRGIVEGLFAVDGERRIRYLNPQAARLLGIEAPAALGRFCGDVLQPLPVEGRRPCEHDCPIVEARAGGSAQRCERVQRAGDQRAMVVTSSSAVDGLQVQVLRDETDLEAARRARDSVLANISHEFRTPLASQQASLEMLREGLDQGASRDQLASLAGALQRGTLRLTQLVDNLLESVRIEAGHLGIRHRDCDLAQVITDAVAVVQPLIEQRRQKLELDLGAALDLHGDPTRLLQVFVNLLANAVKFAPEGSAIGVGARREGSALLAWVDDDGPGVPPEAASTLFERFSRGPGEEPAPGGLGLGLWIARSIVERHGGAIEAGRSGAGRTRFSVRLPLGENT